MTHTALDKVGTQTCAIKLNGLTALRRCSQITLVNNSCNIHLVLMLRSGSSYQQSGGKYRALRQRFDLIQT